MPLSMASSHAVEAPNGTYPLASPGASSPPSYQRSLAQSLHLDALTIVTRLHLLEVCRLAVHLAQSTSLPPLPARRGGAPRRYTQESLLLLALLRTLWRLSYQEVHDWLCAWPALALACGLPLGPMDSRGCPVRRSSRGGCAQPGLRRAKCSLSCWCARASGSA
jgi:hypothetical protein